MAIAGLVVMAEAGRTAEVRARLESARGIVGVEATADACRVAVVLEAASDAVEAAMTDILAWEDVLAVDLAFVNYEDDLEERGHIACPPHKGRGHGKAR